MIFERTMIYYLCNPNSISISGWLSLLKRYWTHWVATWTSKVCQTWAQTAIVLSCLWDPGRSLSFRREVASFRGLWVSSQGFSYRPLHEIQTIELRILGKGSATSQSDSRRLGSSAVTNKMEPGIHVVWCSTGFGDCSNFSPHGYDVSV